MFYQIAGYLRKMNTKRTQNKTVEAKAFNTNVKGRPRRRWIDKNHGIKYCKQIASDGDI